MARTQKAARRARGYVASLGGVTPPPVPQLFVTVIMGGSSTHERYFSDGTGPANALVTYTTDGVNLLPLGTMGGGATVLGDEIQRGTGKAVRFGKVAVRGTKLSEWIASGSTQRANLVAVAIALADPNAIVPMYIGGNDAIANGIVSEAQHLANYRLLLSQIRTETGFPNIRFLICGLNQTDPAYTDAQKAQLLIARRAELQVAEDSGCRLGVLGFDLPLSSDLLHMADASYPIHAKRLAGQANAWFNGAAEKRGDRIVAGVRVSDTQTRVTLLAGSGSDFTPKTGVTGFTVSAGAISAAVAEDRTHVLLTHASSAGRTFALGYVDVANPDLSGILYNNGTPPLPAEPTKALLSVTGTVAVDFLDTYTAPDDTTVASARVTDSGHITTVNSGTPKIDGGAIRGNGTAVITYGDFRAKALTTAVRATLICRTAIGSIFFCGHVVDAANQIYAGYQASAGGWTLNQRVGDVATTLGSSASAAAAGTTYVAEMQFSGDATAMTVRLLVGGVEVIAPKAITDAALRSALAVGARFATSNSATTGWAIDRLETVA